MQALFDIGKTNKKFFIFDKNKQEVLKRYQHFEETIDDDGFPCDDLPAIAAWAKTLWAEVSNDEKYNIKSLEFMTYGASFVHLDEAGNPVTPLYNYLKPYPKALLKDFYKKYGSKKEIARATASPASGMLNSGFQLYWLKYEKPDIFSKIRWSLHFPQYLSYLFTGKMVSEYTSIGCHTSLWDYEKNDYHDWVYAEKMDRILPPIAAHERAIVGTGRDLSLRDTSVSTLAWTGRDLSLQTTFGIGIHDSSATLVPYLSSNDEPFLLISTGTWCVSLNPFSEQKLSAADLQHDCLHYMQTDGKTVRASRLFLGNEYALQIEKLNHFFEKKAGSENSIPYDNTFFAKAKKDKTRYFAFQSIPILKKNKSQHTDYQCFENYEIAYHQLIFELVEQQVVSAKRAIGRNDKSRLVISKIYIEGGFADNVCFIHFLKKSFPKYQIY